ncbi:MAG: acetylxylan esterase [Verrucomicrobia bacterium]|nr:acetylxylan esterase [Verrucomicrobiota bacterium]
MKILPALTLCLLVAVLPNAWGAVPRALPAGELPDDIRLRPLKDLNGYFPFIPPTSKAEWEKRAERVRRRILVAEGLWPMPTKTPLNAVIHGKIEKPDYTVEKVYFESTPGFFVTGNLYRPKGRTGKVPAVLFAHGHWRDARFFEEKAPSFRAELATGQERFEEGGKSRFQSMCVQLARMGCIVWQWDMLGDSDSQQIPHALVHRFATQRPEMNTLANWGLFSPQAEANLQSIMGLQTLNAVRSLDFVLSLAEVDPERIAITGASGGGTQTMLLAAVDPRVTLSFPAVMVSTAMQGGCTCENSSLLRVNTGNVEFAGLFAPKPQGMTTANDWTKEMATKGFPELKQLYTLLGAPRNVMLQRGEHFPHNYNAVSRSAFYTWLNQHFKLGSETPVIERDYERLKRADLTIWDDQHPAPKAVGPDFERSLTKWLRDDAQKLLAADAANTARFRRVYGGALDIVLNGRADIGEIEWQGASKNTRGSWSETAGLLWNKTYQEMLPAILIEPQKSNGQSVIWLSRAGKSALYAADGSLAPEVKKLVEAGAAVLGVDLLYQGEFVAGRRPLTRTPRVENPREAAAYTFGYNDAVFVQRVHDVLSAVKFAQSGPRAGARVSVVGLDRAGPWVAAARAQAGGMIDRAVVDTGGFRFGKVLDLQDPDFLPGGAKYGDLPGMLAMGAPAKVWVAGETEEGLALAKAQYRAANAEKQLTRFDGSAEQLRDAAMAWLLAAN